MKEMKDKVDSSNSYSSSDSDKEDELDEQNHKEGWSKKRKIISTNKKSAYKDHYQKSAQVFKKTKFSAPTIISRSLPPPQIINDALPNIDSLLFANANYTTSYGPSTSYSNFMFCFKI